MSNSIMTLRTSLMFVILAGCFSCQKVKSVEVNIPEYPDIGAFYLSQVEKLASSSLRKEVTLDGKSEIQFFQPNRIKWEEEFIFLTEMNPSRSEYVGAFNKELEGNEIRFTLKEDQNGILKKFTLSQNGENYTSISASIHEDKYVYVHSREVKVTIENGTISAFDIEGYQKIILQDTVRFRIVGKID